VTVVADSSPLVILTKLGRFDLLNRLFPRVYISAEVHSGVFIAGAGLPGSSEVSKAEWTEQIGQVLDPSWTLKAESRRGRRIGRPRARGNSS
jgi:predicted nucleic acid-binding protein